MLKVTSALHCIFVGVLGVWCFPLLINNSFVVRLYTGDPSVPRGCSLKIFFGLRRRGERTTAQGAAGVFDGLMSYRVLTIDDDPQTTSGLKRLLERVGYEVQEENDARRALRTAKDFRPDIVILDYLMPELHGGDVAWQLMSDPFLHRTRVIICTALSAEEVAAKLPPARIPIVEKPVDPDALLTLLQQSVSGCGSS